MADDGVTRAAVSVSEMARMCGLSRSRFHQLVKAGTFPPPDREPATGRPCYFADGQAKCLEVRRRNLGFDGRPILFYARRRDHRAAKVKIKATAPTPKAPAGDYDDLIAMFGGVKLHPTTAQVGAAVREKYPGGIAGLDIGVVFKAILPVVQRQNSTGSIGG